VMCEIKAASEENMILLRRFCNHNMFYLSMNLELTKCAGGMLTIADSTTLSLCATIKLTELGMFKVHLMKVENLYS